MMVFEREELLKNVEGVAVYLKAVAARKHGLKAGCTIPRIARRQETVTFGPKRLKKFFDVCPQEDRSYLPMTAPHIIGFGLHMQNLTDKRFPLPLMGLVHIRSQIKQMRRLGCDEALTYECFIQGHRAVARGYEFDMETHVFDGDELVWAGSATMLSRRPGKPARVDRKSKKNRDAALPPAAQTEYWALPANLGRLYGMASGDINPIHLSPLTARLFGFKRAIVHGMWSLTRVTQELDAGLGFSAAELLCQFVKPIFLPTTVTFGFWPGPSGESEFKVISNEPNALHLSGNISVTN